MFENEAKGWYGSYSRVGKVYAERFYIISHKEEIFNRENKKIRIKDFFNPDEIKQKSSLEENLDVFKIYTSNKKRKEKILNSLLKNKKNRLNYNSQDKKKTSKKNKNRIKLSHIHDILGIKGNIKINQPNSTNYNPNYNYIKPKLLEGPLWKDIPGRRQKGLNPNEDKIFCAMLEDNKNYKYYVLKTEKSKCLVDMNKTTQRGEFSDIKDLRIRTDKPFIKPKKRRNKTLEIDSKNKINKSISNNIRINISRNKINKDLTLPTFIKNFYYKKFYNNKNMNKINNDNKYLLEKEIQKSYKIKNINKNQKTRKKISKIILKEIGLFEDINKKENENNNLSNSKDLLKYESSSLSMKNINRNNLLVEKSTKLKNEEEENKEKENEKERKYRAPNFDKTISREQVEKAKGIKFYSIPFMTPNYSLVTERTLSLIDYDKSKLKNKKINKQILGFDYTFLYEPDKIIDKYNNHITPRVPNFNYMTSRPYKKNSALPTYMQKIHDKYGIYNLNEKSLSLNNFSNRGYFPATSTFFPKKSYNNIINYCLINSKKKMDDKKDDDIKNNIELLKMQVNYEPETYEKLIQEGTIDKFDKVSLRTNERYKKEDKNINKKKEFLYK